MENFFYDDEFYSEMGDLLDRLDLEDEDIKNLDEDWAIECKESVLEPLVTITYKWIINRVPEERWPEDSDRINQQASEAIKSIDFDKVDSMMPRLYYPTRRKFTITKKDLLEYIS